MTTVEILKAAKQVISKPEAWCQGARSRDKDEKKVDPNSEDAVQFCIIGSTYKVSKDWGEGYRARQQLALIVGGIAEWNDAPERTHAEVMAKFDEAIRVTVAVARLPLGRRPHQRHAAKTCTALS